MYQIPPRICSRRVSLYGNLRMNLGMVGSCLKVPQLIYTNPEGVCPEIIQFVLLTGAAPRNKLRNTTQWIPYNDARCSILPSYEAWLRFDSRLDACFHPLPAHWERLSVSSFSLARLELAKEPLQAVSGLLFESLPFQQGILCGQRSKGGQIWVKSAR